MLVLLKDMCSSLIDNHVGVTEGHVFLSCLTIMLVLLKDMCSSLIDNHVGVTEGHVFLP